MWSRAFWLASLERTVGAALVSLATSVAATGNVTTVDWATALGIAGAAAIASLAASFGKGFMPPNGSPSLVANPPGRHARS